MRIFFLLISFYLYLFSAHILVYHRFDDNRYPTTNTSKKALIKQFEYFKNNGYKVVKLSKLISYLKEKKQIPSNWIVLTIDDGYKSFLKNGFEIFKKYNYPFTIFIYVKATGQKYGDFLTWEEIKQISKSPLAEFGIHSYAHPHLTNLTNQEIKKDTLKAIKYFKKHLRIIPKYYAYPYGEYDDRVKNLIKPYFEAIFNQNLGDVTAKSDIFDINRCAVVGKSNIKEKLKYKTYYIDWISPKEYPKDNILKKIVAKVNQNQKYVKLFISGYAWKSVKVNNGFVKYDFNKRLVYKRNRIIIGKDFYTISTKLLIRGRPK